MIRTLFRRLRGRPVQTTTPIYRCCLAARIGGTEAHYWLHRVRDHGVGQP